MLTLAEDIFKYNFDTWKKLAGKILKGKIILFVGAGLSHGSGLPDWAGLIKHLCDVGDVSFNYDEFIQRSADYLQECASLIEDKLDEENLAEAIRDIINNPQSSRDFTLQKRLIKLIYSNGGVIITTNYDRFLEIAADEIVGHQTHSYPYTKEQKSNQPLLDILNLNSEDHEFALNKQLHIFKLHGDIESSKLVLSKKSYDIAYGESYTRGILNQLYEQDILFLGCSLSDSYFSSAWRGQQTRGEWFVLYPTNHSQDIIQQALDSEKNNSTENLINHQIPALNIRTIYYKIDDMNDTSKHSECLSMFLSTLEKQKSMLEPKKIRGIDDLKAAEADNNVLALQFCPWRSGDEYMQDQNGLLKINEFKRLKRRIKQVVFAGDYPNSYILAGTFKGWTQLKEVHLCPKIKHIEKEAFSGCSALQNIYTYDGEFTDEHNYNRFHNRLKNIDFIGEGAFRLCQALDHIDFSQCSNLLEIPANAFEQCNHMQEIYLPISLRKLGARCFRDCTNLKTLNWVDLNNLNTIGQEAFINCRNLRQIILPKSLIELGKAAFQEAQNAYLTGLDACCLEIIPEYVFKNCDQITAAMFPNTVKTISQWAMAECDKLKTVVIPTSVTEIDANAFTNCSALENVIFMGDAKIDIADNAFSQCSSNHQKAINQNVNRHKK